MMAVSLRSATLSCLLLLSSCGTTPQTHYYVLSSHRDAGSAKTVAPIASDVLLGVGPITVADYLNRMQITLNNGNALELDPFHHWGEPLNAGITRVLFENLSWALGRQLVQFPWRSDEIPAVQLRVHVAQLNRQHNHALIHATWTLAGKRHDIATHRERFEAHTPVRDASYEALAAAYSLLLQQLAQHIAEEVRRTVATTSTR